MPIEFEDELGAALRRTADTFQPGDSRSLVDDGYAHGRRLRRRRTLMVTAGVAAFAAIGVGGVLAGTLAKSDGAKNSGVASAPARPSAKATPATHQAAAHPPMTAKQVADLFLAMLPKGHATVLPGGRGTEDDMPAVNVLFDAGKGPGAVGGYAQRDGNQPQGCPDPALPGTKCSVTHVRGGTLEIFQGYEYPDHRGGIKDWTATFYTAEGHEVGISEWNATAEKGAPRTLVNPPLTAAQLAAIVTDHRWQQVIAAIPPTAGKQGQKSAADAGKTSS